MEKKATLTLNREDCLKRALRCLIRFYNISDLDMNKPVDRTRKRAGLSLNYVLKYVGDAALSGLPMFSAASLLNHF